MTASSGRDHWQACKGSEGAANTPWVMTGFEKTQQARPCKPGCTPHRAVTPRHGSVRRGWPAAAHQSVLHPCKHSWLRVWGIRRVLRGTDLTDRGPRGTVLSLLCPLLFAVLF